MASNNYEYYVWQDFNINNNYSDHDSDVLDIQLHFHHVLDTPNRNIPLTTTHRSFCVPRTLNFSSDDEYRSSIIDAILSTTHAPREFIDLILSDVSSFALEMVTDDPTKNSFKVVTMGLFMCVVTSYNEREVIDRVLSETLEEENYAKFKPASESCIERLKRAAGVVSGGGGGSGGDGGGGEGETCMVCLEKESVGEEIIELDCGHVFHGDCIVEWLETSHLCPLCRFSVS